MEIVLGLAVLLLGVVVIPDNAAGGIAQTCVLTTQDELFVELAKIVVTDDQTSHPSQAAIPGCTMDISIDNWVVTKVCNMDGTLFDLSYEVTYTFNCPCRCPCSCNIQPPATVSNICSATVSATQSNTVIYAPGKSPRCVAN